MSKKVEIHCECYANTALMHQLLIQRSYEPRIATLLEDNKQRLAICGNASQVDNATSTLLKILEPQQPLAEIAKQQQSRHKRDQKKPKKATITQKAPSASNTIKIVFCDLDKNQITADYRLDLKKNRNQYVEQNYRVVQEPIKFYDASICLLTEDNSPNRLIYIAPAFESWIENLALLYNRDLADWGFNTNDLDDFCKKRLQRDIAKQQTLRQAITNLVQAGIAIEGTTAFKPLQTLADWLNC